MARTTRTLSQLLGLLDGAKADAKAVIDRNHHLSQRQGPFDGQHRRFAALEESETGLPAESEPDQVKRVQAKVPAMIDEVGPAWAKLLNLVASVDASNCTAKADVVLADGTVFARDVPAVTLLAIERQLTDVLTFIAKLPTLSSAESWHWDEGQELWVSEPAYTFKTKKIEKGLIVVPATDKHPAQAKTTTADVRVGTWTTVMHSGAVPPERVRELRERARTLQDAVREARARANGSEAVHSQIGNTILGYVFGE